MKPEKMSFKDIKSSWKNGLSKPKWNKTIELLSHAIKPGNQENKLISLKFRHTTLKQAILHETDTPENLAIRRQQLLKIFLEFIDDLSENDIIDNHTDSLIVKQNDFFDRYKILVVCLTAETKEEMEDFISRLPFTKESVSVCLSSKPELDEKINIVVFDNRLLPVLANEKDENNLTEIQKNHLNLMKKYIAESAMTILHFGKFYYLVNQHGERIYAANYKISLYSRLREVAQFLNDYQI